MRDIGELCITKWMVGIDANRTSTFTVFGRGQLLAVLLVDQHPVLLLAGVATVLQHLALGTLLQRGWLRLLPFKDQAVSTSTKLKGWAFGGVGNACHLADSTVTNFGL